MSKKKITKKRKLKTEKLISHKKKYSTPKLTVFGNVAQFTQTTSIGTMADGGGAPYNLKMCIAPASELDEHRFLIEDQICQKQFQKAINEVVKPNDVVLDLGTGSGIHAFFALQAGAKKVYAIDGSSMIEIAKEVAEKNGYADRIEFVYGMAGVVDLPEKVDLIITNIGFLNTIKTLPLAYKKYLKKGGKILPHSASLSFVPVQLPNLYEDSVEFWNKKHYGFDLSPIKKYASSYLHQNHCSPKDF